MPEVVQRLQVEVTGDTSHAERKLDDLGDENKGGKWAKKLAVVGAAAFAGVGVAAGAFATKAIMGASDVAEQISKVERVFGESSSTVTNFANKMAKDFGTPKAAMLEAAGAMGLIGKASGLAQADAAKLGVNMAKLATDASSFYNVPLPEALQAIQSGLVGEAEPLRRFGVLLNEANVEAEALRMGLVKTSADTGKMSIAAEKVAIAQAKAAEATNKYGKDSIQARTATLAVESAQQALEKASAGVKVELTEGQKVQARQSLIMRGMTDASGDLERTQGSLANRLREVQGRAINFAADVGAKLLPVVLKAADAAQAWAAEIGPKLGAAISAAVPVLQNLARTVASFAEEHGPTFLAFFGAVGNVIGALATTVIPLIVDALGFVIPPLALIGGKLLPVMTAALNTAAKAIRAVGGFIEDWKGPLTVIATLISATLIPALLAWAAQTAATGAVTVFWWVAQKTEAAVSAAAQVAAGAQTMASWLASGVRAAASGAIIVGSWVASALAATANAAVMAAAWFVAMGPVAWVIAGIAALAVVIIKNWDTIKNAFTTGARWAADKLGEIVGFFQGLPGRITGAIGNAGTLLVNVGKSIMTGLWNGIVSMGSWLTNQIQSLITRVIPNPVKSILGIGSPSKVMAGLGRNVAEGLAQGMLDSRGLVAKASSALTNVVPSQVDLGVGVNGTGLRPSSTALAGSGVTIHAPISITEVAPGEGQVVASELAAILSRVRMRG